MLIYKYINIFKRIKYINQSRLCHTLFKYNFPKIIANKETKAYSSRRRVFVCQVINAVYNNRLAARQFGDN